MVTAKYIYKALLGIVILSGILAACSKSPDSKTDGRLVRRYCNDPDAVNYNTDFPGTPDNTICYYPTQLFKGNYLFVDSIYDQDLKPRYNKSINIQIYALSNTKLSFVGFCEGTTDSIKLTADRYYKAVPDSSVDSYNTKINGRIICNGDTLSGYMQKYANDSSRILVRFTLARDSGINFHYGTAIKQ